MIEILIVGLIILVAVTLSITGMVSRVRSYGKKYTVDKSDDKKKIQTVIILGAGIRDNGEPCDLLADRLETGAETYKKEVAQNILLTGDNSKESRSEVNAMSTWINKNYPNIKEENILLDNFGFCTFESIYRAKNEFNITSAIICTNKYHLPRAIYIARKLGIEAYGMPSDLRKYDRMKRYKKRELLAQVKDFILANI